MNTDRSNPLPEPAEVFGPARKLAGAFVRYLKARLSLAGLEGQEALGILLVAFLLLLVAAAAVFVAWLFLGLAAVETLARLLGGANSRVIATIIVAVGHICVAIGCVMIALHRLRTPLFPVTLEEFNKDEKWLENSEPKNAPQS
jgi:uncharacterized membrane protein YqjE